MDQAQSLREYMHRFNAEQHAEHSARVITITSGKGGVGKSNFTLNFALGLKAAGKKVIVLDLDLSTANLDILMGLTPLYSLVDVLYQRKYIWDVLEKGTDGIEYISGGFEMKDLLKFDEVFLEFFWSQIQELQHYADFILLDTGAGLSKELVHFILASDETILVTTPEPTSIADAYGVLKTAVRDRKNVPVFRLVVNRAQSYREAVDTSRAIKSASSHFLKIKLNTLGFIMEDGKVRESVLQQTPFMISFPNCEAARNIKQIVHSYFPEKEENNSSAHATGIKGFFEKIMMLGKAF
ncbi:MinD/ParA family protein [Bacillus sp. EB01]|uniref:MinD/ParA family protein n=1 Tax=Bacillus sp. EB01 TaxID=1347086 RepID=UPI0005C5067D|nr:MinD/ParA family protein [Bacillus sp. EB01]